VTIPWMWGSRQHTIRVTVASRKLPAMRYIIYVSAATHRMQDRELIALLEISRARNFASGISGMLLYKDGSFMQLLEGPPQCVAETYDRIARDPRHHDLTILRDGAIDERNFPDWSMGFRSTNAAELAEVPGFAALASLSFTSPELAAKPHVALRLLKTFHQTTR
jgi:hypothetical protein